MFPVIWRMRGCSLTSVFIALLIVASRTGAKDAWERPGCHKVGKKHVNICNNFKIISCILSVSEEKYDAICVAKLINKVLKSYYFFYSTLQYHNLQKL
jgi:hypothetical protein